MINKHSGCIGLVLFKTKKYHIQLWYAPKGTKIKPHRHSDQNSVIVYIFGIVTLFRSVIMELYNHSRLVENCTITDASITYKIEKYKPKWFQVFKNFQLPADTIHWFEVGKFPFLFINFSTFINGQIPVSAANNFQTISR